MGHFPVVIGFGSFGTGFQVLLGLHKRDLKVIAQVCDVLVCHVGRRHAHIFWAVQEMQR